MAHSESMKQVFAKLRDIGLEMYSDKFEEQGFDDLSMLEENTKEELEQIADSVNMKPGHKMKLLKLAKTDAIALGAAVQPAVQLVQPTVQPVQPAVQLAVASPAVVQPDVMTQNAPPQQMPNINIVNTNTNTNTNTNKHGFNGLPCCPCGIGCQVCLFSCFLDSCCCGPCGCCGDPRPHPHHPGCRSKCIIVNYSPPITIVAGVKHCLLGCCACLGATAAGAPDTGNIYGAPDVGSMER